MGVYKGVLKGIGIYWAWDIDYAVNYWGGEGKEIIIEAVARCEDIDFLSTIVSFVIFSKEKEEECEGLDCRENEIRIKKGSKLRLVAVYRDVGTEDERIDENTKKVEMERDRVVYAN